MCSDSYVDITVQLMRLEALVETHGEHWDAIMKQQVCKESEELPLPA